MAMAAVALLVGPAGVPVGAQAVTAEDGRALAGETLKTQTRFRAVWGDRAFEQWAVEHNAELR